MEIATVVVLIILAVSVIGFASYKQRRPYEPGTAFRVPYLAIQFLGVLAILLLVAYLSSLF